MAIKKSISKKTVRTQIAQQLEKTFADLEQTLGKSQFKKNIKKASKALSTKVKVAFKGKQIAKAPVKKAVKAKVLTPKNGLEGV